MSELKPEISSSRRFNAIWIVPVVAVVIGIYMVVHTKLTEGPQITISFTSADGIEAGKTKLRYRDVDIGIVESVGLSESMENVLVTVKLDRAATDMLREDTRFWVVTARIGAGAITGLGTILSGAYIQIDPGSGKEGARNFTGLEVPPLTPADAPGVRLVLYSEDAGSVSAGDAIVYHGFKVGRIESVSFDSKDKQVRYDAFVDAPYNDLVTTSTRFWNVSGISVDASAAGIRVSTGSLDTILLGGVAFDTLPGLPPGDKAESGAIYKLNASYAELEEDPFQYRAYFITRFTQSLRGLEPGAPVEYRGIEIGRVQRILIKELALGRHVARGSAIPVLIYLEPGRLGVGDSPELIEFMQKTVRQGMEVGLRASLQTGNLLTGALYVSLDFYPDAQLVEAEEFEGYTVIPSIPSGLGRMEQQVAALLDKFNALPLETTVGEVNRVLVGLDKTLVAMTATLGSLQGVLDQDSTMALTAELNATLAELRKALAGLSPDSAMGDSLTSSLYELNRTLRNIEELTRTLGKQPNALLFPVDAPADPTPEANAP
ncbi:MAG: intermembrane transport protein PqiB [Pseudomonadales bacterium]|nr:intermembrane transport protein PqiB [Halieaceae bacterium]MCP5164269.1 intermembrane transport protein PqiB [Pseudomonadales bacterium]MCP5189860.1 intermembrane transport protein PqiB [Pseudomonadales bacterium]MCP5203584.1 intermembrane transport protein PqiB [Pseudomonadales bacterium]